MKNKKLIIIGIIVTIILLLGIIYAITINTLWNKDYNIYNEGPYKVFYGKIVDTFGIYELATRVEGTPSGIEITIEPDKNDPIRKSADKIVVYLEEAYGNSYEIGTPVKVVYTGEVKETYPAQVDCISVTELQNSTVNMYKKILEDLIKQDAAINSEAKFIAIDFENFLAYHKDAQTKEDQYRRLSENEKQELLEFCKQYNSNVIEANFEQLQQQGYWDEERMSLAGILISVSEVQSMKENKAILRVAKYRSALGAVMPKYEVKLVNDYYWELKVLDTMIS